MCGIVAVTGGRDVVPLLIEGLQRLEYRGYDSAGIAVLDGGIKRVRSVGRVAEMRSKLVAEKLSGLTGIGHTRWATHGGVTEPNAHPHISMGEIAVVHNGIIENHEEHRARLKKLGYVFESQTDTEVIAHLIHQRFDRCGDLFQATQEAVRELVGAYAIGVLSLKNPDVVTGARMGCPLLVGLGEDENFLASDVSAVLAATRKVVYLEDGDVVELRRDRVSVVDRTGTAVSRRVHESQASLAALELGPYEHYMQKEIHEQPKALTDTISAALASGPVPQLFGARSEVELQELSGILILAAGTSYYAGLTAKYWIESLAKLPVSVEIASEYRYRASVPDKRQLVVTISQSGETMDTLEALRHARELGQEHSLSICNVAESSIPRASEFVFYTQAGAEIGVASTKAFTTQLAALFMFAVTLAKARRTLPGDATCIDDLRAIPRCVQEALNLEPQIRNWARHFAPKNHALFLGRGVHYPIALEGALKLKEISYIHAEAYPAGELKHGPLALVDQDMPVVVIAPNDALLEKVKSNMQEVRARGGELFVLTDQDQEFVEGEGVHVIRTPPHAGLLSPIVHAVPVQLLAYHTALLRGTDVDKPRNLAKSVTVE